ncbi:MAG: Sir2 family NAD-dependent protein deacetylase [Zetaproteobacteria bacterium]|nr:MAG: Sir2 family NAD-dependent protein deacetylase [Zetaproteobacteria bacterium]
MEQLLTSFRQGDVILFIGSGVSAGLGLPTWDQLIDKIAKELGYDPSVYKTFGNHYALAEYYRIEKGNISGLTRWMDKEWHSSDIDISTSRIHELIAHLPCSIMYTTNYDRWLENSFKHYGKEFVKISSVSDLTKVELGKTQIIKFHGDFDDDSSIVLDETSYFKRLDFETPLDIKLRSDVLGKSVLFVGYSLSDINLRYLFYKLSKLWEINNGDAAQPRSYIFSPRPNAIQEAIFDQWGINMISSEIEDPEDATIDFLEKLS